MLFVYLDSHFDVFIKQYLAWDQMSFRKPEPENFSPWKTWSQFLKDPQAYFFVLFFFFHAILRLLELSFDQTLNVVLSWTLWRMLESFWREIKLGKIAMKAFH